MQRGFVSGLLSRISHVPDRLLHNGRRRAALATLATAGRAPASVLVICNGNIFRSPFAAAVLRRALELRGLGRVRVDSAGFAGPGRPTPLDAVAAAARRGVDLTSHSSQLVMADVVRAADLIVVMDAMLEQGPEVCVRVYARIERCVEELAQALGGLASRTAASSGR